MFLHFNYTPEVEDAYRKIAEDPHVVRMVVGREIAPEKGTPHLQGYIKFDRAVRFTHLQKLLPAGSSGFIGRKGTETQASSYCAKDGDLVVNKGTDSADGCEYSRNTRDGQAALVIEEIEAGSGYGQIRKRHKVFCFWHRRHVLDYIADELKYSTASTLPGSPDRKTPPAAAS